MMNEYTKLKDIKKKDLEYLISFIGAEVHCISDYLPETISGGGMVQPVLIERGNFYKITNIYFNNSGHIITDLETVYLEEDWKKYYPIIRCDKDLYYYYKFFEHFELRTLQDVRRDKIKSILE